MAGNILVVDNYDSFVYTIVDYLNQLGARTTVVRNDAVSVEDIAGYDGVLISPGPGTPQQAGESIAIIQECARTETPMLGVCLGHQALAEVCGATVAHAPELMHGKTSSITHNGMGVFAGLPSLLEVTRYHSLAVEPGTLPDELAVTATVGASTPGGAGERAIIMAVEHKDLPLWGVQFHPESVMTQGGHRMLANWLELTGMSDAAGRSAGKAPLIPR